MWSQGGAMYSISLLSPFAVFYVISGCMMSVTWFLYIVCVSYCDINKLKKFGTKKGLEML